MPDRTFRRHDLLRVTPAGWRATLRATAGLDCLPAEPRQLVEDWAASGWPVIVRRPAEHEAADGIAIGLPLPPSLGKLRLGFTLASDCLVERIERVPLKEAADAAPVALHAQLGAAIALGARLSVPPAVFGALLWQHVTGLAYLRHQSDIDLIWPAPDKGVVHELLEGLGELDQTGPARVDGEIILPGGEGVNWRELRGEVGRSGGMVLVKSMNGAELRCARHLFA
jgi:phosphoribosyl-dephospho-CoA transferase